MAHDPLISLLDTALRGAAVVLFLLVAVAVLRQSRARPAAWLGAALAAGAATYSVCSAAGHPLRITPWLAPLLAVCAGNVVIFWLFTRAVFDESFRPRPWHAALWLALVACPVAGLLFPAFAVSRPVEIAVRIVPVALVLLALAQTVSGWRGDLVEGRRRLRLFIIAAVAIHTAISAAVDLSLGPDHVPPELHLLNAAALVVIATVIAVVLLQADLDSVLASPAVPGAVAPGEAAAAPGVATTAEPEPVDPRLLATLDRLMTVERLYRQEGLTIGTLAAKLGLPERQVRYAINHGLGYRNFNDYLNRHRLADAKQALADPAQAKVPILTIALDSGFQSLGPFNRAFKADTGVTPTEFRRAAGAAGKG
jgi:AraC-like DNA-binding protein